MKWSEEQTVIFVKTYLQHEYLWNTKHEQYGNKYMRKKAYKNISSVFGAATNIWLEEREVMAKLRILSSTYGQEVAKIKKRKQSGLEYTPAMKWFQYWHRCKYYNEPLSDAPQEPDDKKIWISIQGNESYGEHDTAHEGRHDTFHEGDNSMTPTDDGDVLAKSELDESQIEDSESETLANIEKSTELKASPVHSNIKPRWGENITVKFVRIYLRNKQLWNANNHNLRQKDVRKKAFCKFRAEFKAATGIDLSEQQIKSKIRSLRSTYAQERTKIKTKSSPDWTCKSNLKWFADWDRHFGQRKSNDSQDAGNEDSSDQKIWLELSENEDEEHKQDEENSNEKSHKTKRWGEQETVKFVKIYLQYEFLYNPKHKYFRQKKLRHEAYNNIRSEFETATGIKLTEDELKNKINVLGSTYAQELTKIKKRASTSQPYTPAMKWFQYWHKYKSTMQQRNARNAMSENQEPQPEEEWSLLKFDDDDDSDDEKEDIKADSELEETPPSPQDSEEEYEIKNKKVKTEKTDLERISPDFVDTSLHCSRISNSSREDEFEHYGRYIASVLRSMNLDKALQIQLEIQNLLSKARESSLY